MLIGYGKGSNPEGVPPSHSPRTEISCRGCRVWFTADNGVCPECGWHRPGYNVNARRERMNNYLLQQRAEAIRDR